MEQNETICLAVANIIRKRSEMGQLALPNEILEELTGRGLLKFKGDQQEFQMETILKQTVEENKDVKDISEPERVSCYYSTKTMTETFARILIKRRADPLLLMAEIVRENSAIYPRPVPLDLFKESPFDLGQEEISECLKKMSEQGEYQDISQTATSIGTIFLYSKRHLDSGYAAMLAEWLDVGQANNP
jgi:hypothetical protein